MINRRLVICHTQPGFHFSSWETKIFDTYFKEVVFHYCLEDPEFKDIKEDDVLYVYAVLNFYKHVKCHAKFGILYAGFGFHPLFRDDLRDTIEDLFHLYTGIYINEGPVWESYKDRPNTYLVPHSCDPDVFKKTRTRDSFKRLIQVASRGGLEYKARHISKESMNLLPYDCELIPSEEDTRAYIPWEELPKLYQNADGFLTPNKIGDPPGYWIDAKYTVSTVEAGMSGCIIFWHDCLNLGNSFETVFEISLDPVEIANTVKDVVDNIDLEKHSKLTAEEFHDKCSMHNAAKVKVDIMKDFM